MLNLRTELVGMSAENPVESPIPLKKAVKHFIWSRPYIYFSVIRSLQLAHRMGAPVSKFIPKGALRIDRIVTKRTDIVIEGFDRSANTFAWLAFEDAQSAGVSVAHHLHVPAQVLRAVALGIPVILLIRDPLDCVISDLIRGGRLSNTRMRARLTDWTNFYLPLYDVKDRCVVANFEVVVSEFGRVIDDVNKKFGTGFQLFKSDAANVARIFDKVDMAEWKALQAGESTSEAMDHGVGRPSRKRGVLKEEFLSSIAHDEQIATQLKEASAIYRDFAGIHGTAR